MATIILLAYDKMRPGIVMLTSATILMVAGYISPQEIINGFSNKGVITIALLFLVSEGVRRSGALNVFVKFLLPKQKSTINGILSRLLPSVAAISALINNTPVIAIFAPIVKRWAKARAIPPTKFLIPLSFATILGGMCTLIGTSTNLVVHSMMIDAGFDGFSMFELGKVGVFIAIVGLVYLILFSKVFLPNIREDVAEENDEIEHRAEAVITSRFPGVGKRVLEFDFERRFGAKLIAIKRNGQTLNENTDSAIYQANDTLIMDVDDKFIDSWGESSFFFVVSNGHDEPIIGGKKRLLAILLTIFMTVGATIGATPKFKSMLPDLQLDMFFFALVTVIIMVWTKMFPVNKYTKFISWDIIITIACAFAISSALQNSGVTDLLANKIVSISGDLGPYALLAIIFIVTNLFTEFITNAAAVAVVFPIAISVATQAGVNPTPFFVAICVAASASFSTPIGYQTNQIVQGIGNYKFRDFFRIGLPLNIITFVISMILIPFFWQF